MGAGVPIKRTVAGVAMGLLLDETGGGGDPIVLTDILGSWAASGSEPHGSEALGSER